MDNEINKKLANSCYLWLTLDSSLSGRFQKIIAELSKAYDTPSFEPHVTLVTGLHGSDQELIEQIDAFARRKEPIKVTAENYDYTHGFFTALFLKIRNTPSIGQINAQARKMLNPFGQNSYMPHMSLLYGEITPGEKDRIIANLDPAPQELTLTGLKLIRGHKEVSQWQELGQWDLI